MSDRRVRDLLAEALELDPSRRTAYLDEACTGDPGLREEVESLLEAHAAMGNFLDSPAAAQVAEGETAVPRLDRDDEFGAYRIARLLGSGGTGTVYEAIQASPRRRVALKVMHAGLDSERALRRFRDEAEILARLKHPGIAHVYEAGVRDDLPFFALEYVEGARDVVRFAAEESLDRPARLELAARICDAVQHGHEKGIAHRDIKPGNVLVDEEGRPKVIDFGIARVLKEGENTGRGDIVGTLPYMSPERFEPGGDADVRSDVYALGVLIYELLTGRLPVDVEDAGITDAARIIREVPPTRITVHDRGLRGDVEAIVHRALAKDRDERYPSAAALADDIRRHVTHHPVEARRGGALYHFARFARRQRLAVFSIAVLVVVSIAAAIVSSWYAVESARRTREAEFQAYVASLAAANAALREDDVGGARLHLDRAPAAHRGWEWHHLRGRLDMSLARIERPGSHLAALALTRDGSRLATAGWGRQMPVGVRDLPTSADLWQESLRSVETLAFHPAGGRIVLGFVDGGIEIRDASTGELVRAIREAGPRESCNLTMVDFSSDGGRFATSSYDGTVRIHEATTGRELRVLRGHEGKVYCVRFGPRGERVYSGGEDGLVRVWDLSDGRQLPAFEGHESNVEDLAFSPDGRRMASGSMDCTVRLWEVESGRSLATGRAHAGGVKAVAFHPDGTSYASASIDRTIRVWSAVDARLIATLRGHTNRVYGLAFHPDRERLVSCSLDGTVRWWSTDWRESVPTLTGHERIVTGLAFDAAGKRLVSSSRDGTVRVWDPEGGPALTTAPVLPAWVNMAALGQEGDRLFSISAEWSIRSHSVPDGRLLREVPLPSKGVNHLSCIGDRLFTGTGVSQLLVHDAGTLDPIDVHAIGQANWALVSDGLPGGRFACASRTGKIRIFRLDPFQVLASVTAMEGGKMPILALSPDGRRLAISKRSSEITIVDWRADRILDTLRGHAGEVNTLAFSPEGRRLASGGKDGTVRLWDTGTGAQVLVLHGHRLQVGALAWSPDGRRLASGGGDWFADACTIRIWGW